MAKQILVGKVEVAQHLGISRQGLAKRGELPAPDMLSLGEKPCWEVQTIDTWNRSYIATHTVGRPTSK